MDNFQYFEYATAANPIKSQSNGEKSTKPTTNWYCCSLLTAMDEISERRKKGEKTHSHAKHARDDECFSNNCV